MLLERYRADQKCHMRYWSRNANLAWLTKTLVIDVSGIVRGDHQFTGTCTRNSSSSSSRNSSSSVVAVVVVVVAVAVAAVVVVLEISVEGVV